MFAKNSQVGNIQKSARKKNKSAISKEGKVGKYTTYNVKQVVSKQKMSNNEIPLKR